MSRGESNKGKRKWLGLVLIIALLALLLFALYYIPNPLQKSIQGGFSALSAYGIGAGSQSTTTTNCANFSCSGGGSGGGTSMTSSTTSMSSGVTSTVTSTITRTSTITSTITTTSTSGSITTTLTTTVTSTTTVTTATTFIEDEPESEPEDEELNHPSQASPFDQISVPMQNFANSVSTGIQTFLQTIWNFIQNGVKFLTPPTAFIRPLI